MRLFQGDFFQFRVLLLAGMKIWERRVFLAPMIPQTTKTLEKTNE